MTEKCVYAITRGSYSDYGVCAIIDGTKEEARALVDHINEISAKDYYDCELEEFMVVSTDVQRFETLYMQENIWDDGETTEYSTRSIAAWPWEYSFTTYPVSYRWVRAGIHQGKGGRLEVYGTDLERVRKTFSDMRAALISDDALRARDEITHAMS